MKMKKSVGFTAFMMLLGLNLVAQDAEPAKEDISSTEPVYQWASIVKDKSSERGIKQHSAQQALGRPNVLPASGDHPCAWSPSKEVNAKGEEFIQVRFKKPIFARQVIVCESFNPGAVAKIYFRNTGGGEMLVWKADPERLDQRKRVITHVLKKPHPTKVQEVRVVLKTDVVAGFNAIDAIGISESDVPFEVSINESKAAHASKPENLGNSINSAYEDYIPQISPDGKTLYFARKMHPDNTGTPDALDIWKSESNGGGRWSNAEKMPKPLNDENHNYVYTITPDGNNLLLGPIYDENDNAVSPVSLSYRTVDGWSEPKRVEINEYYNLGPYNEFYLGSSKKVMLMTLERKEGYGDNDMYVSFLNKDKTWTKPKNLGPIVNSANVEASPFLAADGKTLYYSTNGFSGHGKMDLFVTRRLDDTWTKWSEPLNLGSTINDQGDESYYSVPASGEYAYFVTNRRTLGLSDIFKIKLSNEIKPAPVTLIAGKVINAKTKQPVIGEVQYEILPEGIEVGIASTDPRNGTYKIALPHDHDYAFHANIKGYIAISEHMDLRSHTAEYEEVERDLYVVPITVGTRVVMKNVGFDRGKPELQEHSYPELDRLVKFMKKYPQVTIRLEGHTDNTGNAELNVQLSLERVETVKTYLESKGVKGKRLAVKGLGGKKPIAPNTKEEFRKYNRRVEYVITAY